MLETGHGHKDTEKPYTMQESRAGPQTVRVPGVAPRWALPTVRAALVLTDALVALGVFLLAYHLREGHDQRVADTTGGHRVVGRIHSLSSSSFVIRRIGLMTWPLSMSAMARWISPNR